jgi:tRNA(Arg) A34 adenosine deaminase TadA
MVVEEGWSRLPEHWRGAFRQAWAAYVAGTIPVGAVVVDPHGVIAAEARNRIFDAGAPHGVNSPGHGSLGPGSPTQN